MEWSDLRFVLAVARAGSALRAAEQLCVNQTTVLRRLDTLEEALGAPLFERRRSGHTLTPAGKLVVEAAERMEQEADALLNTLAAQRRALSGSVRLTTSESIAAALIAPWLRTFQQLHPEVMIDLLVTDEPLDLARGQADVAIRAGFGPPRGGGVVARRLPNVRWTVFCGRRYAAERGMPVNPEEIGAHAVVGMEGRLASLNGWQWLAARTPPSSIRCRSNSLSNLVFNLKGGLGLGMLPTLIGDAEPELIRCFAPPEELISEMWLIVREDVKTHAHVRAFADFLAKYVRDVVRRSDEL